MRDIGKISVIVPVYNSEKYLERCVDSILAQTYDNLEIILVDDGSTDSSSALCEKYAQKDPRIVILSQENQGVSRARTTGVQYATGSFIGFVDADDWCEPEMYQILYKGIETTNADICQCHFDQVYPGDDARVTSTENNVEDKVVYSLYAPTDYLNRLYGLEEENYLYDKLFRTEVIIEYWKTFPRERFAEDMSIMYKLIMGCKQIACCDIVLYHYFQNAKGLSEKVDQYKYQSFLEILCEMDAFYQYHEKQERYDEFRVFLLLRAYIECVKYHVQQKEENIEVEKKIFCQYVEAFDQVGIIRICQSKMKIKKILVRMAVIKPMILLFRRKNRK
ncbi:MAG: glycosyltransferase [Lachnospiraceae bacterium]|nr:glycosyltransferase [Lachnospiraceae bacterium]